MSEGELAPGTTGDGATARQGLLNRRTTVLADLLLMVTAFAFAYLLRFDFSLDVARRWMALEQLPFVILVQFAALYFSGALAFVWKYVGLPEMWVFVRAIAVSTAVIVLARLLAPVPFSGLKVPLSIALFNGICVLAGLVGARVLRRAVAERMRQARRQRYDVRAERVLLVGAGSAGVAAVKEFRSRRDGTMDVMGFVDDDHGKHGAVIAGVKVLGGTRDIPGLVRDLGIESVILTMVDVPEKTLRRILAICETVPVHARMMPSLYDILRGTVSVNRFQDVRITDLLARDEVALEKSDLEAFLKGRSVLVTGAGGSIGSELARQAARFEPSRLVLFEQAEPALFSIDRELREEAPRCPLVPVVGDVTDRERLRRVFAEYRPQVVVHAAAHKHVPLMETNASEAVKNNVFGTLAVAEAAGESGAETFILISTDKAVRPTSVMGATKRVAELAIQGLGARCQTRYVAVRFGNVLGSAGSVIPIFRDQIARGGPVTVTHPEMKRYFMTIPEAAVLTLQAGAMGRGGEIFVLDMGEPVRIVDLARRMIDLSGRPDVEIAFTGMRPGEKLFEELQYDAESMDHTRHPKIYIGRMAAGDGGVAAVLPRLRALAEGGSADEVRRFLAEFLPEAQIGAGEKAVAGLPAAQP